jgi:hypothetical protein
VTLQRSTDDASQYPCGRSDKEPATDSISHIQTSILYSYSYFCQCPLVIELKEIQDATAPLLTFPSLPGFVIVLIVDVGMLRTRIAC